MHILQYLEAFVDILIHIFSSEQDVEEDGHGGCKELMLYTVQSFKNAFLSRPKYA